MHKTNYLCRCHVHALQNDRSSAIMAPRQMKHWKSWTWASTNSSSTRTSYSRQMEPKKRWKRSRWIRTWNLACGRVDCPFAQEFSGAKRYLSRCDISRIVILTVRDGLVAIRVSRFLCWVRQALRKSVSKAVLIRRCNDKCDHVHLSSNASQARMGAI